MILDGALFIALMLFNQFKFHPVFVFFSSLILVPQIAHNAMRAERTESNHPTLYLLAFFKLLIPVTAINLNVWLKDF